MSIAFLHMCERGIDGFVTYILFIFSLVFFFEDVCIAMNFGSVSSQFLTELIHVVLVHEAQMFAVKLFYASERAGDLYLH